MSKFQETIEWLLQAHSLLQVFQAQDHFHVRFEQGGFMPLVIERHGDMISVAHYFEQEGDLIQDPEVEFHYPSWFPTAITQAWLGRREKIIQHQGGTFVDTKFHNEVTTFTNLWARNIRAQHWDQATIKRSSVEANA